MSATPKPSRFVYPVLTVLAAMAVGFLLLKERAEARVLQGRVAALDRQADELACLRAEQERLGRELRLIPPPPPAPEADAPAVPPVEPAQPPVAWAPGEWTPAEAWRNEGQGTPRATMATLLWAAAAGDLGALRGLLLFDDATRARAEARFAALPPAERQSFATAEEWLAGATLYRIAPTRAQLSWLHQANDDQAIVGLLLTNPEPTPAAGPILTPAAGGSPPALRDDSAYKVVVLNLRRTAGGWQVLVPGTAIDGLSAQGRTDDVSRVTERPRA